jgi:hypothetical protein
MYISTYALLLLCSCCTTALPLSINASVLLYSCCTHTLLIYIHVYTPALLLLHYYLSCCVRIYVYALIRLYSGLTFNIYIIYNIGIYSYLESCRTKACHIKALLSLY